jgi:hypothetical protein
MDFRLLLLVIFCVCKLGIPFRNRQTFHTHFSRKLSTLTFFSPELQTDKLLITPQKFSKTKTITSIPHLIMQTDTFENSSTAINKTEGIKEQIIKKTNTSNRVVHYCESLDEGADQKKDPIGLLNQKTDRSYRFYLFTNTSSKY